MGKHRRDGSGLALECSDGAACVQLHPMPSRALVRELRSRLRRCRLHFMLRTALAVAVLLSLVSCVAPSRSVRHGDAYAYVMETLDVPPETRVFVMGQYSPTELPAAAWIGNVGYASAYTSSAGIEQARQEGRRLKADFVVVYTSTSGVVSVLGVGAYRLLPSNLGYAQENGIIGEILTPEAAAAGLQVGDRILAIGGVPFSARIRRAFEIKPGELVPFKIQRAGVEHEVSVPALPNPPKHMELAEARSL